MLRITKSMSAKAGASYYDNGLKRSDYYVKETGFWAGRAAEMLGLKGEVQRKDFVYLAENRRPGTEERLTQRTNTTRNEDGEKKENRRAGYDFTFSVPKSVSLYLALNEDRLVEEMIDAALGDAMAEVESRMETKVRKAYQYDNRVSPNMAYAKFVHRESRPVDGIPDPHYHIHCFAFNATFDPVEQEWKALEVGNTCGDRTYYEAVFHARLADRLIAAGIDIRRAGEDFELASVSGHLVEKFSKRTREIEKYARENSVKLSARATQIMKATRMSFDDAWAQAKSEIGEKTRQPKSVNTLTPGEQLGHWRCEMTPEEIESLGPENIRGKGSRNLLEREIAEESSVSHLFERRSVVRTLHAAGMLLRRGIGKASVKDALEFAKSSRFVPIGKLLTTAGVMAEERAMIKTATAGQDRYEALGKEKLWTIGDERVATDCPNSGSCAVHSVATCSA
jgi:conjugative relaxase-like TrwC/TraI family protein